MERDHGQTAVGTKNLFGTDQAAFKLADLIIYVNADRLKCACGRIGMGLAGFRHDTADNVGELFGRLDGMILSNPDDGTSHPARMTFFTEAEDDIREVGLAGGVHHISSAFTGALHTHIQRAVLGEGKTAFGNVDLRGGNPKIKSHAVNAIDSQAANQAVHVAETPGGQLQSGPVDLEQWFVAGDGVRVTVDTEYGAICGVKDRARIPAATQSAVDIDAPVTRIESVDYFVEEYRCVSGSHLDSGVGGLTRGTRRHHGWPPVPPGGVPGRRVRPFSAACRTASAW